MSGVVPQELCKEEQEEEKGPRFLSSPSPHSLSFDGDIRASEESRKRQEPYGTLADHKASAHLGNLAWPVLSLTTQRVSRHHKNSEATRFCAALVPACDAALLLTGLLKT